jgi:hypothetical protein
MSVYDTARSTAPSATRVSHRPPANCARGRQPLSASRKKGRCIRSNRALCSTKRMRLFGSYRAPICSRFHTSRSRSARRRGRRTGSPGGTCNPGKSGLSSSEPFVTATRLHAFASNAAAAAGHLRHRVAQPSVTRCIDPARQTVAWVGGARVADRGKASAGPPRRGVVSGPPRYQRCVIGKAADLTAALLIHEPP